MGKTKACKKHKIDMRAFNKGPRSPKRLTEQLIVYVTPQMSKAIMRLIEEGYFPSRSEFLRHLITRYLDNKKSWLQSEL